MKCRLLTLAALPLLLSSCALFRSSALPITVQDARTSTAGRALPPARVDVFGVCGPEEQTAAMATPVDEYFSTLGLETRPTEVSVLYPAPGKPAFLYSKDPHLTQWPKMGADALVAVASQPLLRNQTRRDARMLCFPYRASDYPSGTASLRLTLADDGLHIAPSPEKLPAAPAQPTTPQQGDAIVE